MTQTTSPHDMTIQELQNEIGKLNQILYFKVCGDPTKTVQSPYNNLCFVCGKEHVSTGENLYCCFAPTCSGYGRSQ